MHRSRCNLQLPAAEMTFKSYTDDHRWKCRCSDDIIMVARSSIARARLRPYYIIQLYSWIISRMFLPAGSAAGSSAGIVLYSRAGFVVFRLAGATRCTDQCDIWQGDPLLPAKFHLDRLRGGSTAPKTEKMEFYQYNCP